MTDLLTSAPDGEQLAYHIDGQPGAPPILTVHGLVSSVEHWPFFDAHYRRTNRVISWEYRGHGGRPAPDLASISVEQFADDGYAVWKATRLPPAITVGLSFGVQVALEQWRRHRDSIRALVLICGTAGHPLDRVSRASALRRGATGLVRGLGRARSLAWPLLAGLRSRPGSWLARQAAFMSGGAHRDSCPREVLDALFAHVSSLPPALIAATVAAYVEHDAFDVLPTITVPTLIIAGDRDELTPVETAERMQHAIPDSELVVFPGHSHLVQVEKPAAVHEAIDRFLTSRKLT
jgi:pimeloyl-ACP methyl ester carboxylesterase